jgi:hypothetical protein
MIDRRILVSLAGCVLFGSIIAWEIVWFLATDLSVPISVQTKLDSSPSEPPGARPDLASLTQEILARPVFSPTRRPPATAEGDPRGNSDLNGTRLTGIVIEPGRRFAIFAAADAKPLELDEGQSLGGWKIETITPREVIVSGQGGSRILRPKLERETTGPAGPTPAVLGPNRGQQAVPGRGPGRTGRQQ